LQSLIRLLVRFILVPLGYLAAVIVGSCVILFGSWRFAEVLMHNSNPETFAAGLLGFVVAGPVLFVMIFSVMWLPGAVGILISEAFAIRSWIFHALNGAISAWIGWQMFSSFDDTGVPLNQTSFVFGAGLAGGFAYWAVAGWSAGFWKPIFTPPTPPPPRDPFNPPAPTTA
jgi:hypothetical protein